MSAATRERKDNLAPIKTTLDNISLSNFSIEAEESLVPRKSETSSLEKIDLISNLVNELAPESQGANHDTTLKKILTGCAGCSNKGVGCDTCGIKQLAQENDVTAALEEIAKIQKQAIEEGRAPFNPAEGILEILPTKVELTPPIIEQIAKQEAEQPVEVERQVFQEISKDTIPETKPEVKEILSGCAGCSNPGTGCDSCGVKILAQEQNVTAALEEIAKIQKQAAEEGRTPFNPAEGILEILPTKVELIQPETSDNLKDSEKINQNNLVEDKLILQAEIVNQINPIEKDTEKAEGQNETARNGETSVKENTNQEVVSEIVESLIAKEEFSNLRKAPTEVENEIIQKSTEQILPIVEIEQEKIITKENSDPTEKSAVTLEDLVKNEIRDSSLKSTDKDREYLEVKDIEGGKETNVELKKVDPEDKLEETKEAVVKKGEDPEVSDNLNLLAKINDLDEKDPNPHEATETKEEVSQLKDQETSPEEDQKIEGKKNQEEEEEITESITKDNKLEDENITSEEENIELKQVDPKDKLEETKEKVVNQEDDPEDSDKINEVDEKDRAVEPILSEIENIAEFKTEEVNDLIEKEGKHAITEDDDPKVEEQTKDISDGSLNSLTTEETETLTDNEESSLAQGEREKNFSRKNNTSEEQDEIIEANNLLAEEAQFEAELHNQDSDKIKKEDLVDIQEQDIADPENLADLNSKEQEKDPKGLVDLAAEQELDSFIAAEVVTNQATIDFQSLKDNIELIIESSDLEVFNDEVLGLLSSQTEDRQIILANLIDIGTTLEVDNKQVLSLLKILSKERELILPEVVPRLDQKLDGLLSKKNYLLNSNEFKKTLRQKLPNLETEELLSFLFMLQTLKKSKSKFSELTLEEEYFLKQMLSALGENTRLEDLTEEELTELIIELKEFILNSAKLSFSHIESEAK